MHDRAARGAAFAGRADPAKTPEPSISPPMARNSRRSSGPEGENMVASPSGDGFTMAQRVSVVEQKRRTRTMMERLEAYDLGMLYWFNSWRSPWLNQTLLTLTHLGDAITLIAVVLLGAALLWYLGAPKLAGLLVLVGLLSLGLEWGVKLLVQRPRPDISMRLKEPPNEPSFPGGHALCSMAVYGSLGLLLGRALRKRWADHLVLAGVALSLVIGLTRVMIGVHYPFDVLVGWLGGLVCLAVAYGLAGKPAEALPDDTGPAA